MGAPEERIPQTGRYADIVHECTLLFSEIGYERASVRMLADRLGMKSGSLYSHMSSKEEVLYWIIVDVAQEFFDSGHRAVEAAGSAEDQVRALCRSHMRVISQKKLKVRVYFDEWRKLDQPHQDKIISLRDEYEHLLGSLISHGNANGEFECEPRLTSRLILSALNSTLEWYSAEGPLTAEELADSIIDLFFAGMRQR